MLSNDSDCFPETCAPLPLPQKTPVQRQEYPAENRKAA